MNKKQSNKLRFNYYICKNNHKWKYNEIIANCGECGENMINIPKLIVYLDIIVLLPLYILVVLIVSPIMQFILGIIFPTIEMILLGDTIVADWLIKDNFYVVLIFALIMFIPFVIHDLVKETTKDFKEIKI